MEKLSCRSGFASRLEQRFIWSNAVTALMTLNGQSVKLGPGGTLEGKFHLLNVSQ